MSDNFVRYLAQYKLFIVFYCIVLYTVYCIYSKSDSFVMCCLPEKKLNFCAKQDVFSSCKQFMRHDGLRVMVWFIATCSFTGNIIALFIRIRKKDLSRPSAFFITNLTFADWLMALYLFMIAAADATYRDSYMKYDSQWRGSVGCVMAGVIAVVSSEMSIILLAVITMERLHAMANPNKLTTWHPAVVYAICIIAWLVVIAMATIPLSNLSYFGNSFYRWSAVCLPLHMSNTAQPGWQYSIAIFLGLNSASLLLVTFGYLAILILYRRTISEYYSFVEYDVTMKTACIVLTNVFCWLPILIIQMCALAGE